MDIKKMLADADARLDKIAVTGADVFFLADARRLLKAVYDQLNKEQEVNADG